MQTINLNCRYRIVTSDWTGDNEREAPNLMAALNLFNHWLGGNQAPLFETAKEWNDSFDNDPENPALGAFAVTTGETKWYDDEQTAMRDYRDAVASAYVERYTLGRKKATIKFIPLEQSNA